nr:RNA-directed DNA polymerase, eukaryota [Tanacetum cinerariifolium]
MDGVENSETTSKTRLSRSEINSIKRQEKNEAFSKNNGDKTTNSIPSQKASHVGSSQNKKSYASSLNGDRDCKVEKQVSAFKGNTLSNVTLTPSLITPALVLDDSCENDHRGVDLNTETDKVNSPLVHTKVMNNSQKVHENVTSNGESAFNYSHNAHNGGSILELLDDMIRVGQSMGYAMEGCMKDIEHIIRTQGVDIAAIHNFVSDERIVWVDIEGVPLNVWSRETFLKIGKKWGRQWISKRISFHQWRDDCYGRFNEVRSIDERFGSMFNQSSSTLFNHFITSSGLVDVKLEGYSFMWAHPSATKMSKLDRFLVSEGIISLFPPITALCLDRHLLDHRPILLREIGLIPFRFYHSWFKWDGFDVMVDQAWNSFSHSGTNGLIWFKKKLQDLKKIIRSWIKDKKLQQSGAINSIKEDLTDIDKNLDSGNVSDEILLKRMELTRQLHDINQMEARDYV